MYQRHHNSISVVSLLSSIDIRTYFYEEKIGDQLHMNTRFQIKYVLKSFDIDKNVEINFKVRIQG